MPKVIVTKKHGLSVAEAQKKVDTFVDGIKKKYEINGAWSGDRYNFTRTGASGFVRVTEGKIAVEVDLSLMLSPLKSKVEDRVRQALDKEFA
jgi:putative polyhydroxyalkanoate system protein